MPFAPGTRDTVRRDETDRRRFLKFVAASPLFAAGMRAQQDSAVISEPKDALNVMDFEAAARQAIPPAHFGYLETGVDDDVTVRANREGFGRIQIRPRRLVDVSKADLRIEIFGTVWETPIVIAPAGGQKAFHPDGELATSRAASVKRTLQILSTASSCAIEEVAQASGRPIWFQLYPTTSWEVTLKLVRRAEAAGCPVLVLTVDLPVGRHTETFERLKRTDTRKCAACHDSSRPGMPTRPRPIFDGIDTNGLALYNPAMTWESVRRLKDSTRMKLMLKGIVTREDALLCCENGVDGIIVSNHGGRAEETGRSTIECLPEVMDAVGGRIPVLVDGGFRRGTDVFKALAMGVRAVGIGRPYLWGLGAFGQAGVERVLDLMRAELELIMRQCGARSIAEIGRSSIVVPNGRVSAERL
jgi:4-hydroxymandelate oxidase